MASPLFSDPGVALATFLHTFGAIGYMGGIAFFVGWARSMQRGHDNPTVLATGASLTYVSILANLFGGFLRTYQPGHPGLEEFGASTWVTVMTLKHLALFAGIGAAVYLFELHAPRLRRSVREGIGLRPAQARNARAMLSTVVASIVVAAVLGGASVVIDIGAVQSADGAGITIPDRIGAGGPYHYQGTVTANAADSGTFEVPFGTSRIDATFVAAAPGGLPLNPYQFTLELRDPTGAGTTGSTQDAQPTDSRRIVLEIVSPAPGTWTYVVGADAAAAAGYALDIELTGGTVFEETVTIAAGESFEINVMAASGVTMGWDWQATGHVQWDIHTHFDGFEAVVQGHAEADAGEYTTQQAGGHSFSWEAEQDVTLTVRIWGDFDIESIVV